jgi:hypothetical protein
MYTRQQYLKGDCTFSDYYSQFINDNIRNTVNTMKDQIIKSKDRSFNDIPLKKWDFLAPGIYGEIKTPLEEAGDYLTLSGAVCVLKAAAREIKEGAKNE